MPLMLTKQISFAWVVAISASHGKASTHNSRTFRYPLSLRRAIHHEHWLHGGFIYEWVQVD